MEEKIGVVWVYGSGVWMGDGGMGGVVWVDGVGVV